MLKCSIAGSRVPSSTHSENSYESPLLKCPDKNATLSFKVRGMIKEEIKMDMISQSSFKTVDLQKVAGTINTSTANFKKKDKVEYVGVFPEVAPLTPLQPNLRRDKEQFPSQNDEKARGLEDQNKKLRDELKEAKKESEKLKKTLEESTKTQEDWRRKCDQLRQELEKIKEANTAVNVLDV